MKTGDLKINEYWDNESNQSMYDKNLLELEISAIISELTKEDFVLDLGCGEGEGTTRYSEIVKDIIAMDISETRLKLLSQRSPHIKSVIMDMRNIGSYIFKCPLDVVITQRSLINLSEYSQQIDVIKQIYKILKNKGKYIMLEGFNDGDRSINNVRSVIGIEPVKQKWHNLFFNKNELVSDISNMFELKKERNFNVFFFLTRVINACLKYPEIPKWDDKMNTIALNLEKFCPDLISQDFSRLKMLVFERK